MKTLLLSAHPGHELRLHHWMERVRPDVFLITDGSGSRGESRVEASRRVIEAAGAVLLKDAGHLSDARVYQAMRDRDRGFFGDLKARFSALLRDAHYTQIVCDGLEGFNTTHDWCHYLTLSAARGRKVAVFDHPLEALPARWSGPDSQCLTLDRAAMERKLAAATRYRELAMEVQRSLESLGSAAFEVEILRPVTELESPPAPPALPPYYETFGEQRVREGAYSEVIRWHTHVRPLVESIWESGP